jgi:catechol 2,3-dioxygenase-like lactoylglutathione lyase family enzyme
MEHSVELATMLCVLDLERSLAYYRDLLGFAVLEREEHIALLSLDGGLLYLFLESPPTPDKPGIHLSPPAPSANGSVILVLRVPDCRATYEELRARGVEFLTPPTEPPWGGRRCFAHDPDGFLVEVEEPPAPDRA